ncbi:unannotated protein [freshwater metagenome]|uniref:Unannotated protein n=1 Tax=freshwater metagenome TaxID=449393 RepID=A0A6J6ZRJ7_9ZZZZ
MAGGGLDSVLMTNPVSHTQSIKLPKVLFGINALVAWCGVLLSFTLYASGYYPPDTSNPTLLGNNPAGIDGLVGRLLDWITYFTILSNLIVAIVLTLLFLRPGRDSKIMRVLRLDTLLMIIITGVIYNLLLGPGVSHEGWDFFSNGLQHVITPILTVLVWLIVGPRRWINLKVIALSLIIPILWAAFALVRGAVIGAYPYSFLDVATKGLTSVLAFIGVIMVAAIILALVLMGIDAAISSLSRRAKRS